MKLTAPRLVSLGICLAAPIGAVVFLVFGETLDVDDAQTFVRYARHWWAGHGNAWNPGAEQVYGNTSLLHTALVALLLPLFQDTEALVRMASFLPGLAYPFVLGLVIRRRARGPLRDPLLACAAAWLLIGSSGLYWMHLVSGMETCLALLLVTGVLAWSEASAEGSAASAKWLVVLGWLLWQTRPDAILVMLYPWTRLLRRGRGRSALTRATLFLAIALIIDAGLKSWLLGSALPLASAVKAYGFYPDYAGVYVWHPTILTHQWLGRLGVPLALIALAWRSRYRGLSEAALLVAGVHALSLLPVLQVMNFGVRYQWVTSPLLMAAALLATDGFIRRPRTPARSSIALALAALLALPLLPRVFGLHEFLVPARKPPSTAIGHDCAAPQPEIKRSLRIPVVVEALGSLPPGMVIATSEHGLLGSRRPADTIVDLSGLHDPVMAKEGFSVARVLDAQADLIWFPHWEYVGMNLMLTESEALREQFQLYPGIFHFGVAVRNDSVFRAEIEAVLMRAVAASSLDDYRPTDECLDAAIAEHRERYASTP